MSIIERGKNTFLLRIYLGRDPITNKRVEVNRTVHGSISYARKLEIKLRAQKYSGKLAKSPRMSINALVDLYLDLIRHTIGLSTHDKYVGMYDRYARSRIGHIPIGLIRPSDIKRLFNFMQDKKEAEPARAGGNETKCGLGLSPATVKVLRNVLVGAFNLAVNDSLIAANPVTDVKVPIPRRSTAASLTIEEASAFVSVKHRYWYGNALVFQLHTGLRNQELMALIWDDVDFENGTLRVERACKWVRNACVEIGRTKTEMSNRVIKLEPEHLELLRLQFTQQQEVMEKAGARYGDSQIGDWIRRERARQAYLYQKTDLIFPKANGKVPTSDIVRKKFKAMVRSAGIKDLGRHLHWYDLRHTHASILLSKGVSPADVAARMGHSVETLLRTYTHPVGNGPKSPSRAFADLIPI